MSKKKDTANTTDADKAAGSAPAGSAAANLPLFYHDPQPLDAKKHAKLGLKKNFGLGFTSKVNAIPVNLIEMPQICHYYPIAFSPDANATPVAILGVRNDENLFLNKDGTWNGESFYIPAYIRRYPFIFSEMPGSEQLSLCVDMDKDLIEEGGEQKFFTEDGKPSPLAENALEFCKSYHAAARQTAEFSKWLVESDLLVAREAQINSGDNTRINFSGFKIIDEKKLAELPDDKIIELHKKGWLPFVYAHLFSGAQWQRLTALLKERTEKKAA
jgi:hypothetical protein